MRAPTPSAAAELALPDCIKEKERISLISSGMRKDLYSKISNYGAHLDKLSKSRCLTSPSVLIADKAMTLDNVSSKLYDRIRAITDKKENELRLKTASLEALNPLKVIARGYSAVYRNDGRLIKSINDVKENDEISFKTVDGSVRATVIETVED